MVDINNTPEAEVILDFIENRLKKRLNVNIATTGNPGSSKSYSDIRLLELHYKRRFNEKFPIENVTQNLEEAILKVKDFQRIGEGIVVEEISVSASVRDSLTRQNKIWNAFLDTCRIKQAVICMNVPHKSFVDKHIIMLTHLWIDMLGVNFRKNIAIGKPLILQTTPHSNKIYKHRLIDKNGDEVDFVFFRKPSKELCEAYDKLKQKNVDELYTDIATRMRNERVRQLKELGKKTLTDRQQEAWDLNLKGLSAEEGANKLGISESGYYKLLESAKKTIKSNKKPIFSKKIGEKGLENDRTRLIS